MNLRRRCAALLGLLVASAGLATVGAPSATAASEWNPALAPIAKQVEKLRGLTFDHPVPVSFLSDAAFNKKVSVQDQLTAKERKELDASESEFRAIGLVSGDLDLASAFDSLQTSGTLAFYDPKTKRVTVRGTDLGVDTKVTLAHELTHALQDQHFDLLKLQRDAAKNDTSDALRALVEGDAVRIQRRYADQLSAADKSAYQAADAAKAKDALTEVRDQGVPDSLSAFFQAPYVLGPPMLAVAATKSDFAIDGLFRNPPASDAAFVTPTTLLDGAKRLEVAPPKLAAGEKRHGKPTGFGAFALYLMLAARADAAASLAAVDGWGGDSMVAYTSDSTTCIRAAFVGRDGGATARLGSAISAWAASMPGGAAHVDTAGGHVELTACDPGSAGAAVPHSAFGSLIVADLRNEVLAQAMSAGLPADRAGCIANKLIADPVVAPIVAQAEADPNADPPGDAVTALQQKVAALALSCSTR